MSDEAVQFHGWVGQGPLDHLDHPEARWESLEKRRRDLIEKEAGDGLDEEERNELEALQKETGQFLNLVAPLPFEVLEQFEERARRAGVRLEEEGA